MANAASGFVSAPRVLRCSDIGESAARQIAARYGLNLAWLANGSPIAGSFWGAPEAGISRTAIHVRADTPVHSLLHELCHIICMTAERRDALHGNAGSDDLEEAAVCYLQIVLGDQLQGVGRERLMRDMDAWGYSFRLGSTQCWFEQDAVDARAWLHAQGLLHADGKPVFKLRGD